MAYLDGVDVGGFGGRRRLGGGGGGGGAPFWGGGGGGGARRNSIVVEIDDPNSERVLGDLDGDTELVEIAYDVVEAEIDDAGAMTGQGRRIARKTRNIVRKRENAFNRWQALDGRLAGRQADLERRGGVTHIDPSFIAAQQKAIQNQAANQLSNVVVGKPLFTSQNLAAGASATFVLTTQYDLIVDRIFFSASVANSLGLFLITSFQVGVDPLGSNPEATSGFSANMLDPANTQPSIFQGRVVRAQSPIRFLAQNTGAAASTLSIMVSGKTNAAQMVS